MFTCISAQQFVGVVLVVVARLSVAPLCQVQATAAVPCGILNAAGNKGGASCSVTVLDTRIVFVAAHLAAGQSHVERRTADIVTIIEGTQLTQPPAIEASAAAAAAAASVAAPGAATQYAELVEVGAEGGGGAEGIGSSRGGGIMEHDIIFLLGDLNYRIEGSKADVEALVAGGDWAALQSRDQLLQQRPLRPDVFQAFREAPLLFAPTYKYDQGTLTYDTSSKARAPAWCDRVLFSCASPGLRLECSEYGRCDVLYR